MEKKPRTTAILTLPRTHLEVIAPSRALAKQALTSRFGETGFQLLVGVLKLEVDPSVLTTCRLEVPDIGFVANGVHDFAGLDPK